MLKNLLSPFFLQALGVKAATAFAVALFFEALVFLVNRRIDHYLQPLLVGRMERDPNWRLRRRAKLRNLSHGLVRLALYIPAFLILLRIFGVHMAPVYLGLVLVVTLAVVSCRDVFRDLGSGVLLLAEDQFAVGDEVRIGDAAGRVESFTLRCVQVRDGAHPDLVHVFPNREITRLLVRRPKEPAETERRTEAAGPRR